MSMEGTAVPAQSRGRELAWSLVLGALIPLISIPFVALGGGAGYLVAVAVLPLVAIASRPSGARVLGVLAGAGATLTVLIAMLAHALKDL